MMRKQGREGQKKDIGYFASWIIGLAILLTMPKLVHLKAYTTMFILSLVVLTVLPPINGLIEKKTKTKLTKTKRAVTVTILLLIAGYTIPPQQDAKTIIKQDNQNKTWHEVTSITSTSRKITDTFSITGEKWRFTWSCNKTDENHSITIIAYKEEGKAVTDLLIMQKCPDTEETFFVYSGPGNYYFDVMPTNIENWKIKVEDWH